MTDTIQLSTGERLLLDRSCPGWEKIERRSGREYDLNTTGVVVRTSRASTVTVIEHGVDRLVHLPGGTHWNNFAAWLPLAAIRDHADCFSDEVCAMSDYPGMVGDWSAIRDSSEDTIWAIFGYLHEHKTEGI